MKIADIVAHHDLMSQHVISEEHFMFLN